MIFYSINIFVAFVAPFYLTYIRSFNVIRWDLVPDSFGWWRSLGSVLLAGCVRTNPAYGDQTSGSGPGATEGDTASSVGSVGTASTADSADASGTASTDASTSSGHAPGCGDGILNGSDDDMDGDGSRDILVANNEQFPLQFAPGAGFVDVISSATGEVPSTTSSGIGRQGSMKISTVPRDGHPLRA